GRPLPGQLNPRLDAGRVDRQPSGGGAGVAARGGVDVVECELEVFAVVPVHPRGPDVHGAAGNPRARVVEVQAVVAQPQLPQPGPAVAGAGRARHAVAVAPGLATRLPQHRGVAAGRVEIPAGPALDGGFKPLRLEFDRPLDPHRLGADG